MYRPVIVELIEVLDSLRKIWFHRVYCKVYTFVSVQSDFRAVQFVSSIRVFVA